MNPFDGNTMISAQLTRLWRILAKLHVVKPVFKQFYVDREVMISTISHSALLDRGKCRLIGIFCRMTLKN